MFRATNSMPTIMLARWGWIVTMVAVPLLILFAPSMGLSLTNQQNVELIILLSLVVSGLNLCYGFAGELALGQVAVYALGAYVAGYIAISVTQDILAGIAIAAVAGPVIGLITGLPALRLGGWALGMVSFFLVLTIPDVVALLGKYTGGPVGLTGIPSPTIFGHAMTSGDLYTVMVIVAALWFAVFRNIAVSRRGRALLIMRQSPVLAGAVGLPVFRSKLGAYMLAAVPAGIAGALLAYSDQYLSPDYFSFTLAVAVLAATMLGGRASVYGAVVASAILQLGPLQAGSFQSYNYLVFGAFLVLGGALLPNGLAGVARMISRKLGLEVLWQHRVRSARLATREESFSIPGKSLEIHGVSKSFGGVRALDDVTIIARPGAVTSIIGPNGSGKTTLLNLINGFRHPDAGTVVLDGKEIQDLPPHKIAIRGVARTFQTPIVSPEVSVVDTVAVGRIGRARVGLLATILRLPSYWRAARRDQELADHALERVGLSESAFLPGTALPLGHRRMLELARALASEPAVILLDEVASGVDEESVAELGQVIRELARSGATVLLVEHNFRLVLDVSDEIFVLASGKVIASGTPEHISSHPDVLEQYLGTPIVTEENK